MKKMKMLVQTTLNDVVRLNAGSGRRMNGKTVLAIVIVFLLLGAGVVNSTRYITSTTDSALYANKWNLTTYSFNNSKVWWASWNASSGAGSSITAADRAKWNATNGSVQRFQSQWNSTSGSGTTYPGKWNLTTLQFNNSKAWWAGWNASSVGNYAPNVTFITTSGGLKYPVTETGLLDAIYSLNGTGGEVKIPAANITMSTNIFVNNNVKISGCGISQTKISFNVADGWGFSCALIGTTRKNISLSDMTIDGMGVLDSGIYIDRATQMQFKNLLVLNCTYSNIAVGQTTNTPNRNIMFDNIYLTKLVKPAIGVPFQLLGISSLYDSSLNNIHCYDGGAALTAIDVTRSQNITMNNIIITRCQNGTKIGGMSIALPGRNIDINNMVVSNFTVTASPYAGLALYLEGFVFNVNLNNFHSYNGGCLRIVGDSTINDIKYVNFNNIFINNSYPVTAYGIFLYKCSNVNINNVLLNKTKNRGFYMVTTQNITVSNLQSIQPGVANLVESSNNLLFSNCIFYGGRAATREVAFDGCSYFSFTNCIIKNAIGNGFSDYNNACTNYSFTNCQLIKNGGKGMDLLAGSNITIMGCLFKDNVGDGIECDSRRDILITGNTFSANGGEQIDNNIVNPSKSVIRSNVGYTTEAWGTFSIAAGASRGTANTNMSCLPNCVYITPMGNTSCSGGLKYGFNATYTGTGGTYIVRIMVPGKLDNTCTFSWYACNVTGGTRHNN